MKVFKLIRNRILIKYLKFFYTQINYGFWTTPNINFKKKFIVDLSNQTHEHFGDQLFFIFAVIQLSSKDNFLFKINQKWAEVYKFFGLKFTITNLNSLERNEYVLVTSFRSFVDIKNKKKFQEIILFDSMDKKIKKPLCQQIFDFFNKSSIRYNNNYSASINFSEISKDLEDMCKEKFYIYNDVIQSRSFIKPFLIKSLKNFLINLNGVTRLFQVGSKDEFKIDKTPYPFDKIDLRGKVSFSDLFLLINHPNCQGYIGFDNAIMHLSLFFNKKVFIKFRGRFLKKNRDFHYRCVNCAVGDKSKNLINYIQ